MPESAVIDTSVTLRMVSDHFDKHQAAAVRLMQSIASNETTAHISDLCLYEMVNVMARKWGFTEGAISASLRDFLSLDINLVRLDTSLIMATARIATSTGLSGYDAAHVAAARAVGAPLITDDARLAAMAPDTAITLRGLFD